MSGYAEAEEVIRTPYIGAFHHLRGVVAARTYVILYIFMTFSFIEGISVYNNPNFWLSNIKSVASF